MKKNIVSRVIVMMTLCVLAVLSCSAAFADGEWVSVCGESRQAYWRINGNGNEISVFQVVVKNAPATIYFEQEEGLCYEDSHTHVIDGPMGKEEEWGKYHVFYRRADSSSVSYKNWDKTRRGGSFELYLNGTGVYYIWVVPYTAQEMTDSWLLDRFIRWNRTPRWWVNCVSSGTVIRDEPYELRMDGTLNTNRKLTVYDVIR